MAVWCLNKRLMRDNPEILLYVAILLTSMFGVGLSVIAISYRKLIDKYYKLKEERDEFEKNIDKQKSAILDDARKKSAEIIQKTQLLTDETKSELTRELKNAIDKEVQNYMTTLAQSNKQITQTLQNISNDIKNTSLSEMDNFKNMLISESKRSQGEIETAINQVVKNLEAELEEYKANRIGQIEVQIAQVIEEVAMKVIGKSLSVKEHEDLVLSALDEAKKRNALN